jgi:hypothetical protein
MSRSSVMSARLPLRRLARNPCKGRVSVNTATRGKWHIASKDLSHGTPSRSRSKAFELRSGSQARAREYLYQIRFLTQSHTTRQGGRDQNLPERSQPSAAAAVFTGTKTITVCSERILPNLHGMLNLQSRIPPFPCVTSPRQTGPESYLFCR